MTLSPIITLRQALNACFIGTLSGVLFIVITCLFF